MLHRFSTLLVLGACLANATSTQAASPALNEILPRGGQRGTEITVTFGGDRLGDAREILFYGPGFETLKLESPDEKRAVATLRIAADCALGEHAMRVRTATGVTELRTFWVGALPILDEVEPNNQFPEPQTIALGEKGVTVHGVVENEDVDWFAFEAKKGERISVEIEAMRLAGTIFDPYVAILDAKRFELAASDDSPLLRQDAYCQAIAPEDGVYRVEVRETSYGGSGACRYRLHVGRFPRPGAIFPAGGSPGAEILVRYLGDVGGSLEATVRLPAEADPGFGLHAEDAQGIAPSANPFRVVDLVNTLEVEPNSNHAEATPATVPGAFNGIIETPGDVDVFRFTAEKGQVLEIEVHARRLRSPLDPVLSIHHAGGGQLALNDDARGPDSYLRFTVPETKEYALEIRDHLGKGSPLHVYRVELSSVQPSLALSIPVYRQYAQDRHAIAVPRGNRYATLLSISRQDFGGDVILAPEGLPAGMRAEFDVALASLTAIPVLFEAANDAPLAGTLAAIPARHADESTGIRGGLSQTAELIVGEPGNAVYWSHVAERLAIVVAEPAPFRISIVEPKVPLVRNGSMGLRVAAERDEGFDAPITLEMVFSPPGISAAGGVTIAKDTAEATIALNANGNAPVRDWRITVTGRADTSSGPVFASTSFATLKVAEPYLTLEATAASVEQGKETVIHCKVNQATAFEGAARVTLLGLPHKVEAPTLEVTKETTELRFPVTVAEDSPPGRHKSVFCRVEIVEHGESIVHSSGGTELRIDKPLPPPKPKADAPPPPEVAVAPPPPPPPAKVEEKPLTRLEKLRLEFEKRNGGVE